jgi:zinc and cadmium transporter
MNFVYLIVSVILVSLFSFVGAITLSLGQKKLQKILLLLVAFSAGALIGDAFIHLLPESLEEQSSSFVSISIFVGIFFFFILEKILRWRHCHDVSCQDHPKHLGTMNLVGDGIHNLIDGLLIGASFSVSIPLGIATTIAVVLHEIPQELADFGVLLHSGYTVKKALLFNFLSGSLAIIAAIVAFFLGEASADFSAFMLPFTVGSFLYIAMSDLIPELHKEFSFKHSFVQILSLIAGIGVMFLLLLVE